ncbi:PPC domain-containing DNA-binding protein [Candidatus Neptunochlamydia vexilliferae]|nr:PPC domain-containing DNA-binding protein [Candidatus Neptunochlamydia vexilliferae]
MEEGKELHEMLSAFVLQKKIPSAFYQGIGMVHDVELGHFNLEKNDYDKSSFDRTFELITATGNISVESGVPFIHTHIVLALLRRPNKTRNFKGLELPHPFVP